MVSVWWLLAVNLLPMVGVVFLGWEVRVVLLVYWAESVVVGVFNVLKMFSVGGLRALGLVLFFVFHYGMFMMVHGVFAFAVSGGGFGVVDVEAPGVDDLLRDWGVWAALIGMVGSHGYSFWKNFLRGGEWRRTTVPRLMGAPYGRVFVMHITVLFGAWGVMMLRMGVLPVMLLIGLKTVVDVWAHVREHERLDAAVYARMMREG